MKTPKPCRVETLAKCLEPWKDEENGVKNEARLFAIRIRAEVIKSEIIAMRLQDEFELPSRIKPMPTKMVV